MELDSYASQWQDLYNNQKAIEESADAKTFEHLIDSYFFIFDCIANNILFVNDAFETVTGYKAKEFTIDHLLKMIHPDDLPYFFASEEKGLNFTNILSFNEHYQYILSYTYRLIKADGTLISIQQQCQAIEVTNQGHLSKTLVIHKRIENYSERPVNDYKIFDKTRNVFIDDNNCYNLTKREVEVLNLIRAGLQNKEIAASLNVSKHTIETHRKRILQKTNSKNFIDLFQRLSFTTMA